MTGGRSADDRSMARFWTWGVRYPMLAGVALAIAAGFAGVLDWSPALALAMPLAFLAEGAGWLAERARERASRREVIRLAASNVTAFVKRNRAA
jgi:hypothetical protein